MRRGLLLLFIPLALSAAEAPLDVDPNTKTEGGADLRGSGANAGSGAQSADGKIEDGTRLERSEPPRAAERRDVVEDKDKPISARKPREPELEDASKGVTKPQ